MVITGVGLVCSIFKHHIFFLLVFSHSTLSLTILLYPGTFKQAFVAFRNKNVYKGKKIGFEFRGGLEKAPPSVLLRLAEEYKNQDTKKWEKTFPWQHPLFIQRVIQNLNLIGKNCKKKLDLVHNYNLVFLIIYYTCIPTIQTSFSILDVIF